MCVCMSVCACVCESEWSLCVCVRGEGQCGGERAYLCVCVLKAPWFCFYAGGPEG